jgi:hypothetical protein
MPTEFLTIAHVTELPASTDAFPSWINGDVRAYVAALDERQSQKGKTFWTLTLADHEGGPEVSLTVFARPKFAAGAYIEIRGKGNRRTEYQGRAQIALSKNATIHVIAAPPPAAAAPTAGDTHPDLEESAPAVPPAGAPIKWRPAGPNVGAAVNFATAALLDGVPHAERADLLRSPDFWRSVHEAASDFCRVSHFLESGFLAPNVRERAAPPATPAPPPPPAPAAAPPPTTKKPMPPPGPGGSAFPITDETGAEPF